jgi:hypothetical protein
MGDCIATSVRKFLRDIADVREIAELKNNIQISINALASTVDCPPSALRLGVERYLHPAGNRGKHTVLDRDPEQQIP